MLFELRIGVGLFDVFFHDAFSANALPKMQLLYVTTRMLEVGEIGPQCIVRFVIKILRKANSHGFDIPLKKYIPERIDGILEGEIGGDM
jgi:hypothetical protein